MMMVCRHLTVHKSAGLNTPTRLILNSIDDNVNDNDEDSHGDDDDNDDDDDDDHDDDDGGGLVGDNVC